MTKKFLILSFSLLLANPAFSNTENTCLSLTELYGENASQACQEACGQTQCYFDPTDKTKSKYYDSNCSNKCSSSE